jgi:hypothetical protein
VCEAFISRPPQMRPNSYYQPDPKDPAGSSQLGKSPVV